MDDVAQPGAHREASAPVGLLLAQVGALASARFAERLAVLGVQPGDVGVLRLITAERGLSQQALATRLGVGPSRVVALIDELEKKGLVTRERSTKDRRVHHLRLTGAGESVMAGLGEVGSAHEEDVVRALSASERRTLRALLTKVAASHRLTPDAHPGHRGARTVPPGRPAGS